MPLSHLRVLDFTQVRSGPTCTKILADFGGEVIRIERPGEPDREREPFDAVDLHRGKKSVLLDLAKPTGLEVVQRIALTADVVQHPVHGPMRVLGLPVLLPPSAGQGDRAVPASRPAHSGDPPRRGLRRGRDRSPAGGGSRRRVPAPMR